MKQNRLAIITLSVILTAGAALRLVGINWDQNQHLHPDERFMTMVTQSLIWPKSVSGYFSTSTSPANPHNAGYPFYVYGTFPLFMTKLASQIVNLHTYNGITLVGRFLSAVADTITILLVWAISLQIFKHRLTAALSAFFYSVSVLPIQLSHFYAVDTFLVVGLYGCFYFLHRYLRTSKTYHSFLLISLSGALLGLSAASKISVALFLPVVVTIFFYQLIRSGNRFHVIVSGLVFVISAFVILRLAQPYLFTGLYNINPRVIDNWHQLKSFEDPSGWFPPAVQWITTLPVLFPLENLVLWGLGIPMSLVFFMGTVYCLKKLRDYPLVIPHLLWIFGLFAYQGVQFAKPLRYFYPLYPSLAIIAGPALSWLIFHLRPLWPKFILFAILIIWPMAFMSIYSRPHSRVEASRWIGRVIPPGSTLSCEYWDDCLPLGDGSMYNIIQLPLYDPDSAVKWERMNYTLSQIDYIIITSNRLYGSIMTVPEKYPLTTKFYSDLFSGNLGFEKVAEFTSRPNLAVPGINMCLTPPLVNYGKIALTSRECPLPGISFVDDYADESWTVYDHPKIIIFSRL